MGIILFIMIQFILVLALLFIPHQAKAFTFTVANDLPSGLLATLIPDDNEIASCSGPNDRFSWKMIIPNPILNENTTIFFTTANKGNFFFVTSGNVPQEVGNNFFEIAFEGSYKITLFCQKNNDLNNTKKLSSKFNFDLDAEGKILNVTSGKAPKVKPPKLKAPPVKLPGLNAGKFVPGKPQVGQKEADLFTLNPGLDGFKIQSTIEPSQDKEIFTVKLKQQFTVEITNNGTKDLVFVVEDLKTGKRVETPIAINETGTILMPKSKVRLLILRVDEPEGFPVDFDIVIKDREGNVVNNLSDLIGTSFDLTGDFDGFDSPEFINLNTQAPIKLAVTPVDAQFDIELFFKKVNKKKRLTPEINGNTLTFDLSKPGLYIARLTPKQDEDDYQVLVDVLAP